MKTFKKEDCTYECFCETDKDSDFRVLIPEEVANNQAEWNGKRFFAFNKRTGEEIIVELDGSLYGLGTSGANDMRVRQVIKFVVKYGTGAGDNVLMETSLEKACKIADDSITYTQSGVSIEDENEIEICFRKWWGVEYDKNEDSSENPICFGSFGYYSDWE